MAALVGKRGRSPSAEPDLPEASGSRPQKGPRTGPSPSTFRPIISRNEGPESLMDNEDPEFLMDVQSSAGNMTFDPTYAFRDQPSSTVASAASSTRSTPLHTSPTSEDYGADEEDDELGLGRDLGMRLRQMMVDDVGNTTGNIKKTSRKKKISKKNKGTRNGRKKSAIKKKRVKRRNSMGGKRRRKGKKTKKKG